MKLSIATSVFLNYLIEDAVDEIISAGYDGIDLWCGRPHLYRKDHPAALYKELRKKMQANGLKAVSVMPAFFRYPFSLSSPVDTIRFDSISYLHDCIINAAEVGAECVLIVPSHSMHGQTTLDASQRYIDSLEKINVEARKANLKLGIEIVYPLLSDYMKSSQDAMLVIDALGNADNLGVVIDSGHLNLSGEDPKSAINNLGNRLLHVHVNDNNGKQQSNDVPGEGTFDFIQFLMLLKQCKYTGYVMAELGWHYSFDPAPTARKSLSKMKEYLSQIA